MTRLGQISVTLASVLSVLATPLIVEASPNAPEQKPPPAVRGADAPARTERAPTWDIFGQARLRLVGLQDFSLDTNGTKADRSSWGESRLIAGGRYQFKKWLSAVVEIDAVNGQFAGDFTNVGLVRGEDTFRVARHERFGGAIVLPRKAYVQIDTPFGRFLAGQQSFNWGLGMLANDGAGEPDFGDTYQGSLVERVAFLTNPGRNGAHLPEAIRNLALFWAFDVPFRDDNASLIDGDFAWAWVAGLRTKTRMWEAGLFVSERMQWDRPDPGHPKTPTTHVGIVDFYGRFFLNDPSDRQTFQFETEMAFIGGKSTRPYLDETFEKGAGVESFGGAWRMRYDHNTAHITAKVEAGYATGDNDPQDATFRQFTFNTDYNVGLILFDQYLPMLSARAVDRLTDPSLLATMPASSRHLVNQGAVSNAIYLNPTIRSRPLPQLDLRAGVLFAWSAGDVIDPFNSARNGGFNMTYGGKRQGSRKLGQEVDVSARYGFDLGKQVKLRVGAEGGVFFPDDAFDGIDGNGPVWMGRGLADIGF